MSPTLITPAMTQVGLILGTAAYMSPEQARGKAVDKRSDIWAFGAVLFEMVSGRRAFSGESVSETLAEVMKSEPSWQALPAHVPAHVVASHSAVSGEGPASAHSRHGRRAPRAGECG